MDEPRRREERKVFIDICYFCVLPYFSSLRPLRLGGKFLNREDAKNAKESIAKIKEGFIEILKSLRPLRLGGENLF